MRNSLTLRIVIVVWAFASPAWSEIYDGESERHAEVVKCTGDESLEYVGRVYLNRDTFGKETNIDDLVNILLLLDLKARRESLSFDYPNDLSPEYRLRLSDYFSSGHASFMAQCAVNNYREGDKIFEFDNTHISPSIQKGYVIVRGGTLVVRILTKAIYVD